MKLLCWKNNILISTYFIISSNIDIGFFFFSLEAWSNLILSVIDLY